MKHLIIFAIGLLIYSGCGKKSDEEQPLVTINGSQITVKEFEDEFLLVKREYSPSYPTSRKDAVNLKRAFLNQLIEKELVLLEAQRLGVRLSAEELKAAIAEVKKDYNHDKTFEKMLIDEYVNIDRWKDNIREKLIIDKVISRSVLSKVHVSVEEAKS